MSPCLIFSSHFPIAMSQSIILSVSNSREIPIVMTHHFKIRWWRLPDKTVLDVDMTMYEPVHIIDKNEFITILIMKYEGNRRRSRR